MQLPPPLIVVVGVNLPLSSAAVAVTTLKVDPGAYRPWVTRLSSGEPAPGDDSRLMLRATVFGLYVGVDAMASTWPVCGSSATTAPLSPPSPLAAACWAGTESDVCRLFPVIVRPVMRSPSVSNSVDRSSFDAVRKSL